MPVNQANFEVPDLDHFGFRQTWRLIKISFHCVHLTLGRSKVLKPFVGLFRSDLSSAENVLHLSRDEEVLEFVRDI